MPEMTNRVAVVTGAASGIGLATAQALAREGADVALLSRPHDDLTSAAELVGAYGTKVLPVGADVGDSTAVSAAFARIENELGPIDAVHNNAGISAVSPLVETTDDLLHTLIRTNLAGSFYVLREAARLMQPRRTGSIVNTASELALMVCPGTTKTPMFLAEFEGVADPEAEFADNEASVAMQRIAEPSEIGEAVVFLLSHRASYITGTHLTADGGRTTCVPAGSVGVSAQ
jgi:NAD(P)-dependent dehydrogenase (short-subunit alcohol dehydrogenase family)